MVTEIATRSKQYLSLLGGERDGGQAKRFVLKDKGSQKFGFFGNWIELYDRPNKSQVHMELKQGTLVTVKKADNIDLYQVDGYTLVHIDIPSGKSIGISILSKDKKAGTIHVKRLN